MISIKPWKTLKSRLVFDNKWCRVRQDEVELPSGEVVDDYFINVRPDIVLILAITCDRKVVFVRQYRHGVGKILLELPGGGFNSKVEDSMKAGARELEEETGYVSDHMFSLATLYDNPVKDTNKIHFIMAEQAQPSGIQNLDITEEVEIVLVPIDEVLKKIEQGEICVSGTIAALFLGLKFLS
ncbi:MAG: NUDIX hydrolase [Moorea sp. SIO3G5]|nr:NUDIX hydrolase [Moorena sp. SIO3G5]